MKVSLLIRNEIGAETLDYNNVIQIHTELSYITMEKTMYIIYKENEKILKVSIPEKDIVSCDIEIDGNV